MNVIQKFLKRWLNINTPPPPEPKDKWIKCPHCETWYGHLTEGEAFASSYVHTEDKKDLKALYTCGKCRCVSEWFTGAPMPINYADVTRIELRKQ